MLVQSVSQAVVTERKSIGRIPNDQFVESRPFIADRVSIDTTDTREVMADVPVRDANGQLRVRDQPVTLQDEPYSPVKTGATSAIFGAVTAGLAGALKSGQGFSLKAALIGGAAAGLVGALTVLKDEVSLVHKDQVVKEPVLDGYTSYATDSAYLPEKPGHWWNSPGGTQFTFIEKLDHRPVGKIKVATLQHSTSDLARYGLPLISSVAAGLLLG